MAGTVVLHFSQDGLVAILALGSDEERAIVLTPERLESFRNALEQIRLSKAKGVVILSPSIDSFCVGADISLIQSVTDPERGAALASQGQQIYDLLEDLKLTTVAAISGPCVGGGCEMVLACTHRIIADHKASSIGLPETKLGILPGFGGTYRLPRVVGLPKALDIILAGKTLRPSQAKKAGLVDEIVSVENLVARAEEIARGARTARRSLSMTDKLLTWTPPGRAMVRRKAAKQLAEQTKGFYPAPPKALDVTISGLARSRAQALQVEAQELGNLIVSPESKSLVHLFFLTESSKGIGKSAKSEVDTIPALVVGAGTMGAGIAGLLAKGGQSVIVKDTSEDALNRGRAHVQKELAKARHLSSFERSATASRIDWLSFSSPTESRTGIVIEAIFENMELKRQIFTNLAPRVSESCILASNTSSLSVTEMSAGLPRPDRFIGMHFFNPVEKMPLVEIIRGRETSDDTVAKVAALAVKLGKFPIVVKDVPGFLVNRILIPYINEAVYLLEAGHDPREIDYAATEFGMPMGPIRLLDEVGLDVAAHVSKVMLGGYGERMAVPNFAEKLLAVGRKGKKNGIGFYEYSKKGGSAPWSELRSTLGIPAAPSNPLSISEITERLVLHLVNEAMKCLAEGVAGEDYEAAKKQIDLGTVMGIGFPPFRGGVLHYANTVGLENIAGQLKVLTDTFGPRYAPF